MRHCNHCNQDKDESEFDTADTPDGLRRQCKSCRRIKQISLRKGNNGFWRERDFGMSNTEYIKLLKACEGKCSICGKRVKLVVDHDHSTGYIRELLCKSCNLGIGHLQDSSTLLRKAAQYIDIATKQKSLEHQLLRLSGRRTK